MFASSRLPERSAGVCSTSYDVPQNHDRHVSNKRASSRPCASPGCGRGQHHRHITRVSKAPRQSTATGASSTAQVTTPATNQQQCPQPRRGPHVTYDMLSDIKKLLGSIYHEYEYWIDPAWIEGSIPKELEGTFFRNGPGLQVTNSRFQRHAFDGDGMVCSFAFKEGRAFFRNKYVRTKGFVAEQAAGRPIHRGPFTKGSGTGSPFFNPFNLAMKNVANTGVLHWGPFGLLAMWEQGRPYQLDPHTLDTVGESDLKGQLTGTAMAAHYRVLTLPDGTKRWVTFAFKPSAQASLTFMEFDEAGHKVMECSMLLPDTMVTLVHDMAVTEHYYVIVAGPVNFQPSKFLGEYVRSGCSVAECLVYDPTGCTRIFLVPRHDKVGGSATTDARRGNGGAGSSSSSRSHPNAGILSFAAPPFFSFHHGNAFELDGGRTVVVDTLAWNQIDFGKFNYDIKDPGFTPDYYKGGARTHLLRIVLDIRHGRSTSHKLARRTMEFPSVNWAYNGKPHRHMYVGSDVVDDDVYWAPLQAVTKLTLNPTAGTTHGGLDRIDQEAHVAMQTWSPGDRCFCFEPLFVPRPATAPGYTGAEDDGWVIATMYDCAASKSGLLIFDARNIAQGPLARITLPHHVPSSLHGSWSEQYFGPEHGSAQPRWKEPNRIRPL